MARPEKPIDWDLVDELLMAGCEGTEIAPHFDMHYNTFYLRVQEEHGVGFSEYRAQKRSHGIACIRRKQFQKALDGDNTLLIWLGKTYVGQRESDNAPTIDAQTAANVKALLDQIAQQQALAKACTNNNTDCKS